MKGFKTKNIYTENFQVQNSGMFCSSVRNWFLPTWRNQVSLWAPSACPKVKRLRSTNTVTPLVGVLVS